MEGISSEVIEAQKMSAFALRVYQATQMVPAGKICLYADIAAYIGCPKGCRAVGNALRRNPFAPVVPCHRVIASGSEGAIGGFMGETKGEKIDQKVSLLTSEGVTIARHSGDHPRVQLDDQTLFVFPQSKETDQV